MQNFTAPVKSANSGFNGEGFLGGKLLLLQILPIVALDDFLVVIVTYFFRFLQIVLSTIFSSSIFQFVVVKKFSANIVEDVSFAN